MQFMKIVCALADRRAEDAPGPAAPLAHDEMEVAEIVRTVRVQLRWFCAKTAAPYNLPFPTEVHGLSLVEGIQGTEEITSRILLHVAMNAVLELIHVREALVDEERGHLLAAHSARTHREHLFVFQMRELRKRLWQVARVLESRIHRVLEVSRLELVVVTHVDDDELLSLFVPAPKRFGREMDAGACAWVYALIEVRADDLFAYFHGKFRERGAGAFTSLHLHVREAAVAKEARSECLGISNDALQRAVKALLSDDNAAEERMIRSQGTQRLREHLRVLDGDIFIEK